MSENVDYLVVYGDSYSDIQPESKATNGPVWSQQLASHWNMELMSLAKPGATFCKNTKKNGSWLKKQVESATFKDHSATHAIFLGVTDLIETKGEAKNIKEWIQCIKDQVTFLCSSNPESRIVIMGVPALEFSPYASAHKSVANDLKQNIVDFNVALEEEVMDWKDSYKNIEFFDTYLVFSEMLADTSIANIDNVDDAYWDKCQGKCNDKMDSYLWWDNLHITGAGHKAISNVIESKEYFNIKSTTEDSSSSLDSAMESITGLPNDYIRVISWLVLISILAMLFYMFRHNRVITSLKQKLNAKIHKAYPSLAASNRNNHEYSLV
ncbi:hypothetical protein INT47_003361 [Mucor saturninus]|uniref:Carbohydrate esterase family 16 protein n=1 Tax=Mucor saturninus TaxID=64648 RepID=A0A8H7RHU5_9FUNG|nr:hypothetical protein INT47_003361 [Mucor saturninus]